MIPRLGDGNTKKHEEWNTIICKCLENDSPSRGRKRNSTNALRSINDGLENDSPSRGRKPLTLDTGDGKTIAASLENDSPSRGRKQY